MIMKYDRIKKINLYKKFFEKAVYHCLLLNLEDSGKEFLEKFRKIQTLINPVDVYNDEHNKFGIECIPHVTILYGLNEITEFPKIRKFFQNFGPLQFNIGKIGSFRNDDKPYDVLYLNIISSNLENLHYELRNNFHYHTDHPNYNPHMTLSYIKKGSCNSIDNIDCDLTDNNCIVNSIILSKASGEKERISLI